MLGQRQYAAVSRTYAEALFRAARSQGVLQRVQEDCRALSAVLERSDRLLVFLANPQAATETKRELIERVFAPRLSPLVTRMMTLMTERERMAFFGEVLNLLQEMVEHAEGIFQAQVASAVELDFQDKLRLKTALEKHTGSRLRIEYQVEPDLIGGLVFRFRDMLIDGSLRSGVERLRRRMLQTSLGSA